MKTKRTWIVVDFGFGVAFHVPYTGPVNHEELLQAALRLYSMAPASRYMN